MLNVNLHSVISRLNGHCRSTLEGSVSLTLSRTHYNVEIEHWLLKLAEAPDADVAAILHHFEIDVVLMIADLGKMLDRLNIGSTRPPVFAPNVIRLIREAWLFGSLQCCETEIRGGHLMAALLGDDLFAALAHQASSQFARIDIKSLHASFGMIVAKNIRAGAWERSTIGAIFRSEHGATVDGHMDMRCAGAAFFAPNIGTGYCDECAGLRDQAARRPR